MKRRRGLGAPGDRVGGYTEYKGGGSVPTGASSGWALTNGQGSVIGTGRQNGCSRIKTGAPGHMTSSHRCSYNFKLARSGEVVACRSFGEGMAASCRVMKKPPRGFAGFRDGPAAVAPAVPKPGAPAPAAAKPMGRSRRGRRH